MNIDTKRNLSNTSVNTSTTTSAPVQKNNGKNFSEELSALKQDCATNNNNDLKNETTQEQNNINAKTLEKEQSINTTKDTVVIEQEKKDDKNAVTENTTEGKEILPAVEDEKKETDIEKMSEEDEIFNSVKQETDVLNKAIEDFESVPATNDNTLLEHNSFDNIQIDTVKPEQTSTILPDNANETTEIQSTQQKQETNLETDSVINESNLFQNINFSTKDEIATKTDGIEVKDISSKPEKFSEEIEIKNFIPKQNIHSEDIEVKEFVSEQENPAENVEVKEFVPEQEKISKDFEAKNFSKISKKNEEKIENNSVQNNPFTDKKTETADENNIISGLINIINEVQEVKKINQTDKNKSKTIKKEENNINRRKSQESKEKIDINKNAEENNLIDNNINIQEHKEILNPQMSTNMNFNSNGQPFTEFIKEEKKTEIVSSAKELEEEQAILSTMEENIAIANKNILQKTNTVNKEKIETEAVKQKNSTKTTEDVQVESKTKTITTDDGIKKVDKKTNITVETVVKYDNIIMNKNDVEFFAKLTEQSSVDMSTVQNAQKSSQVSKTLADMLAKSMQDNKPIRIDFDNDISVIIKISKDGKISADFLPSSQVAEAYLKENLPLLKQKFDDNNIDYDELNHRKQRQQDNPENRKKGRKDE